jgi:N-formylglutamate amidohydrolase
MPKTIRVNCDHYSIALYDNTSARGASTRAQFGRMTL